MWRRRTASAGWISLRGTHSTALMDGAPWPCKARLADDEAPLCLRTASDEFAHIPSLYALKYADDYTRGGTAIPLNDRRRTPSADARSSVI
jgi:hypothetical protein